MGLRDKYTSASPIATPAADIAPSTPLSPAAGIPSSASPALAASRSGPVAATPPTSSTPSAKRDLVALRARLSGGTNGGVNPPEAPAAVTEDLLEPNTRETPEGGAEMLPNHPDFEKGKPAATAPTAEGSAPAKRKRRTKAEMEAARAAEAAAATAPTETPPASVESAPPSGSEPAAGTQPSDYGYVGREELDRIATALERIVNVLETRAALEGIVL